MNWSRAWQSDRGQSGDESRQNTVVQQLYQIGNFVRSLRTKLRFGEMSRAPLRLLRFKLEGNIVECDWMARRPDPWDEDLSATKRQLTATQQALEDSLAVRTWLFRTLPGIESATLRVFREAAEHEPDLIMIGGVTREEPDVKVLSVAMRAKLYGFQFWPNNGAMEPLST